MTKIKMAYNEAGDVVYSDNAVKGERYFCPKCGGELIFKNSGKRGPGSRCKHFSHKAKNHDCTNESILHSIFKHKAAKLLREKIDNKIGFVISWKCGVCGKKYENGNLLKVANEIKEEYCLEVVCRPDIAILDISGKVRIAIEIVVTHEPEEKTLKYYRENGIILVQYNVIEDDIFRVEERLKTPDRLSLCLNEKCKEYNALTANPIIRYRKEKCPKCDGFYYVFFKEIETAIGSLPYPLTKQDCLDIAKKFNIISFRFRYDIEPNNRKTIRAIATHCFCSRRCQISYYPMRFPYPKRNRL